MKSIACIICLLLLSGCNYIGVAGGQGGEFDTTNFTLEFGGPVNKPGEPGKRDHLLVTGITHIDTTVDTWFYESGPEIGSFVKYGPEITPDTGLFVTILGGITFRRYRMYWGDEETDVHGMFGGGVSYFINNDAICIQTNFDNRRGFTVGVGYRF